MKGKILELIQTWAHAFRNEPSYKAVEDTYHLLKMEGEWFFFAFITQNKLFFRFKAILPVSVHYKDVFRVVWKSL